MSQHITRRRALCSLIAFSLAGCSAVTTGGQGGTFSSVKVDTSAINAAGYSQWAAVLVQAGTQEANRLFSSRLQRNAPRLVIRITKVSLNMYAGREGYGRRGGFSGGSSNDYVEGEALVYDQRGRQINRVPLLSTLPSGRAGPWYASDNEARRLDALARNAVQWFERKL